MHQAAPVGGVQPSGDLIDSGNFKGAEAVDELRKHTEETLAKYVDLARRMGMPAESFMMIGTDAVDELELLCKEGRNIRESCSSPGNSFFRKTRGINDLCTTRPPTRSSAACSGRDFRS
jgi:hypothetical protein